MYKTMCLIMTFSYARIVYLAISIFQYLPFYCLSLSAQSIPMHFHFLYHVCVHACEYACVCV